MQGRHHRHRAVLHLVQGLVPHAGVVQALAGVALAEFGKVQPCAEVLARAAQHRCAHRPGQAGKRVAHREDQRVVERIALGRTVQAHDGNLAVLALGFDLDQGVAHLGSCCGCIVVIKNNQKKPFRAEFRRCLPLPRASSGRGRLPPASAGCSAHRPRAGGTRRKCRENTQPAAPRGGQPIPAAHAWAAPPNAAPGVSPSFPEPQS